MFANDTHSNKLVLINANNRCHRGSSREPLTILSVLSMVYDHLVMKHLFITVNHDPVYSYCLFLVIIVKNARF